MRRCPTTSRGFCRARLEPAIPTIRSLGGYARLMMVNGELSYSLAPDTHAYFRTDFVHRTSSSSLAALSPLTGSLDDLRLTLGLNHTL